MSHETLQAHAEKLVKDLEELEHKGDHHQVIEVAHRASDWLAKNLGETHELSRQVLTTLAYSYEATSAYDSAQKIWLQLVQLAVSGDGVDHPNHALALNNLAESYRESGQYAKAEPVYQKALAIVEKSNVRDLRFFLLSNLGLMYKQSGDYARAETLYKEALNGLASISDDTNPVYSIVLRNLAIVYELTRPAEAAHCYRRTLDLFRRLVGANYLVYDASIVRSLARIESKLGRHNLAIGLLLETIKACIADGRTPSIEKIALLNCYAEVAFENEDFDVAELAYLKAITWWKELPEGERRDYGNLTTGLATVYLRTERYREAEGLFTRDVEQSASMFGEFSSAYGSALNNLAMLYCETGRFSEAVSMFQKALPIVEKTKGRCHPDTIGTLAGVAIANEALRHNDNTSAMLKDAAQRSEEFVWQSFAVSSDRQRLDLFSRIETFVERYLGFVLFARETSDMEIRDAYDFIIRRKGMSLEASAFQHQLLLNGRYLELEAKVARLKFLRSKLGGTFATDGFGADNPQPEPNTIQLSSEREYLEAEVARLMPDGHIGHLLRSATLTQVANAIAHDAVLVDFIRLTKFIPSAVPARGENRWQQTRYVAFVISGGPSDACKMVDLGDASIIEDAVSGYWQQLAHPSSTELPQHGLELGFRVRELLIDPLVQSLGKRRRLLICPDGVLSILPFEAVPTCSDRLLIDDFDISYLSTVRDLVRVVPDMPLNEPIVIADPNFSLKATVLPGKPQQGTEPSTIAERLQGMAMRIASLPGTRREGTLIARILGVLPWMGDEALDSRLKAVRSPKILHIASHGFFLPPLPQAPIMEQILIDGKDATEFLVQDPMYCSGLVLAGAETILSGGRAPMEAEDGLLTAADVIGMDLRGTELVVLSACETALGEIRIGEGVLGLRRAFTIAGARTLVMSCWKVDDSVTAELMEIFYRSLVAGAPKATSLRSAQLQIKTRYKHPFYWAPFILQGDPGKILDSAV
jgi:CHAT domain-containing protein/tetratricopeptide (TPR) repeat protein